MSGEALEFSFIVDVGALPKGGKSFVLSANETERAAIAKRLGVPAVARLNGKMSVTANASRITIKGDIDAELTRICVASLDEMTETIAEDFEIEFLRHAPETPASEDDEDWLNAPEVHESSAVDLGELLVQQLSLSMAAFPRKEGAPSLADEFGHEKELSPFAEALAKLGKEEENQ